MRIEAGMIGEPVISTLPKKSDGIRPDFEIALQGRMREVIGMPGSEARKRMESVFGAAIGPDNNVKFDKLSERAQKDLKKLQTAAEAFEAHFVKDLMSQMRKTTFSTDHSQTADMAKDFMDEAIGESTAKGPSSIGIAKTVFVNMGEQVVRAGAAPKEKSSKIHTIK